MTDASSCASGASSRARRPLSAFRRAQIEQLAALRLGCSPPTSTPRRPSAHPERVRDDHLADALVALELPVVRAARASSPTSAPAPGSPGSRWRSRCPKRTSRWSRATAASASSCARWPTSSAWRTSTVVHGRAETWTEGLGRTDVVTARALAPLDVVAEYAAPLLALGGALVAWRGQREPGDEAAGRRAAEILGLVGRGAAPRRALRRRAEPAPARDGQDRADARSLSAPRRGRTQAPTRRAVGRIPRI